MSFLLFIFFLSPLRSFIGRTDWLIVLHGGNAAVLVVFECRVREIQLLDGVR